MSVNNKHTYLIREKEYELNDEGSKVVEAKYNGKVHYLNKLDLNDLQFSLVAAEACINFFFHKNSENSKNISLM
jgi:hypothetical protein